MPPSRKAAPPPLTEDDLLDRLKRQRWVEDWDVDSEHLRCIARALVTYAQWRERVHDLPSRIAIDGSERKRITKLVEQIRKFQASLAEATRHAGVKACLLAAYPRANEHLKTEDDVSTAIGHLGSLHELADAGDLALDDLRKETKRGTPGKYAQHWLYRELETIVRAGLPRGDDPLLSWDEHGAETARVIVDIVGLIGITVSSKTVQNLLSRPEKSEDFRRIFGISD